LLLQAGASLGLSLFIAAFVVAGCLFFLLSPLDVFLSSLSRRFLRLLLCFCLGLCLFGFLRSLAFGF
jgi:hypothetical protein